MEFRGRFFYVDVAPDPPGGVAVDALRRSVELVEEVCGRLDADDAPSEDRLTEFSKIVYVAHAVQNAWAAVGEAAARAAGEIRRAKDPVG